MGWCHLPQGTQKAFDWFVPNHSLKSELRATASNGGLSIYGIYLITTATQRERFVFGRIVRIIRTVRMSRTRQSTINGRLRAFVDKERIEIAMPRALVQRIDRWWHANRVPNRSEAIRVLIERGLSLGKIEPPNNKTAKKPAD
jgi:hypothetical protein